jgi:hypothetical protein
MVQTNGLTHINLAVRDPGRALRFYEQGSSLSPAVGESLFR